MRTLRESPWRLNDSECGQGVLVLYMPIASTALDSGVWVGVVQCGWLDSLHCTMQFSALAVSPHIVVWRIYAPSLHVHVHVSAC
jgi:hypothetical protein